LLDGAKATLVVDFIFSFDILFEVGSKLRVSPVAKRMKFFRAFNYIYGCVGATASPMVLCHLLNTFCLPILLYG